MIYLNYLACAVFLYATYRLYKERLPRDKAGNIVNNLSDVKPEEIRVKPWTEMKELLYLFFGSLGAIIVTNIAVGYF